MKGCVPPMASCLILLSLTLDTLALVTKGGKMVYGIQIKQQHYCLPPWALLTFDCIEKAPIH